ncbi:hypothetical protein ACQKM1_11770 [Peribacillus frigoritolerans]|uniref:hypothetical protein n=1 Tax=Peribacillus frigoritolerans TaxID=450367 RepID=UPI003D01F305
MNFHSYSKLYNIYTEEKSLNQKQKAVKLLFTALFWVSLLFILLSFFDIHTSTVIYYYIIVLTVIELLLLFVFMALYESTTYIISFSKTIPIKPNQLFFYHLIKSNLTAEIVLELTIVISFLLFYGAPTLNILLLLFLVFSLKFLRTYSEFFILWFKKYQVRFPYFSAITLLIVLIFYINSSKLSPLLSKLDFTITTILLILCMFLVITFITYPIIVGGLIKEKGGNLDSRKFNHVTNRISTRIVNILIRNKVINGLIKYNFFRLLRDVNYISKLITINITVIVFNILSMYLPFMKMEDIHTNFFVDTIYIAFFVNFLNLTNIKIEYKLHQKLRLDLLPVSLKTERIAVDITNSFFLFVTFTILLLLKVFVEGLPLLLILDGYKAFYCFLILSLILDCFYKYEIKKKIKALMIVSYMVIGIFIESLFIIKTIFIIQLTIAVTLTLILYLLRYRGKPKKQKVNNYQYNGN